MYIENSGVFKNKIINGDFRIWQRGTSVAGTATTQATKLYQPDRFFVIYSGLTSTTAITLAKSSMTINSISKISARATKSAIAGSVLTGGNFMQGLSYILEDYDSFSLNGQKVTLSFWFNATVAGTYSIAIRNGANTNCLVTTFTVSASTPTKIFKTFTVPSTFTTSTPTGASGLEINIGSYVGTAGTYATSTLDSFASGNFIASTTTTNWLANATADFIEIAQVQFELGDTATDFESRPYQVELALCQRYYEKSFDTDTAPSNGADATSFSTTAGLEQINYLTWTGSGNNVGVRINYRVTKRTSGTLTRYGNSSGYGSYNGGASATGTMNTGTENFHVNITFSSPDTRGFTIANNVTTTALLGIKVHWSVNADF
jgi:hypothetical protein